MKNLKKTLSLFFIIAMTGTATPSLNSKCGFAISTPPNGNGIIFDETCTVAYVLPPKLGMVQIGSLARTTNLQFCPAVKSADATVSRTFGAMEILSEKIGLMLMEFQPLDEDLTNLKLELKDAQIKVNRANQEFSRVEAELNNHRDQIVVARREHENCIKENSIDDLICIGLKNEWDEVKKEFNNFRQNKYREKQYEADDAKDIFEIIQSRYTIARNRYIDAITPVIDLQEKISGLNASVLNAYQDLLKLEGAVGQIIWSVPFDLLLEDYRSANINLQVNWQPIPIKQAEFLATVLSDMDSTELGSMSGLKSAAIPGIKPAGFSGIGKGAKVEGAQLSPSNFDTGKLVFGSSVSGQIILNLMGACPYFENVGDNSNVDTSGLSKYIVVNLIYDYEVAVRRGYTAHYNLASLLRKIEEKTQKGGFFSTSSAHSIIESGDSSDWFSINFDGNSSKFNYTEPEQLDIAKAVKQELFDKAFQQFAVLNAGGAVSPHVPSFVENGAETASSELRKCAHHFCQAGSALIGVANSIWGKSKAVAEFYKNNDVWATEKISGIQFVNRSASLTFGESL